MTYISPLHEQLLKKAERGTAVQLNGKTFRVKAHVYSDAAPLLASTEHKLARHMVGISNRAFGERETKVAFGKNAVKGAKRFFHGDLTHYLFFLETPRGKPVAYAQVAISEPYGAAYYTSAAISPETQGGETYSLLNVLRAAACVRHLVNSGNFHVATRTENPKVMIHYASRGWFPKIEKGRLVFSKAHRRGLSVSRLGFLVGRASGDVEKITKALEHAETLLVHGPAEAGTYSGKLAIITPDERAAALLSKISVIAKGKRRKFNAAKGDSLYFVTSPANLKNWLTEQKQFIKSKLVRA